MTWLLFAADLLTAMAEVCRRYGTSPVAVDEPAALTLEVVRAVSATRPKKRLDMARPSHVLQPAMTTTLAVVELTPRELEVILLLRSLEFGYLDIQIEHGIPVFIRKIQENIKLSQPV